MSETSFQKYFARETPSEPVSRRNDHRRARLYRDAPDGAETAPSQFSLPVCATIIITLAILSWGLVWLVYAGLSRFFSETALPFY